MGHKVHARDGAGVVAKYDNMPEATKRFWTKVVELSAVRHQPEDRKFSDGANGQCRWNGHLSWYAAKLHTGEERREGDTFENHWVHKASPNSNAGSNCWWEKTTTLAKFEKEDFTQIRGVSKGHYSQNPGRRMDEEDLMLKWLKIVWGRRPRNQPSMRVLDTFKGHLTDSV